MDEQGDEEGYFARGGNRGGLLCIGLAAIMVFTTGDFRVRFRYWNKDGGVVSDLMAQARQFWYDNEPGAFVLDGLIIARGDIHRHGGPSPEFDDCETCQKAEWLSRVRQRNMFIGHSCRSAGKCRTRCERQGDDQWTNYHQDFWFMMGCSETLNASRCLIVFQPHRKVRLWERFWSPYCDFLFMNFRRLLAQTCQVEVVQSTKRVNWHKYDFVIYQNLADGFHFPKPPIPMAMIMYDVWLRDYQWTIDHFDPEYILTPYPTTVRETFDFNGRLHFYPLHDSTFFARPNVTGLKEYDLILAGSNKGEMYGPRRELDEQARQVDGDFLIEYSHRHGALRHRHTGPVQYESSVAGKTVHYLNAWSGHLGSAKFAAFASFGDKRFQPLFAKYYEIFGSGAVPIVPEIPDLKLLGVKPMEHYIPLSVIWNKPKKLRYVLRNHKKYRRIAENAVRWHRKNEPRLLWDQFEDFVRSITGSKYPRRVY